MSRLSESLVIFPLLEAIDGQNAIDSDGVNLGLFNSFTAAFSFGAITGNSVLIVYAGATAAKTTAIAFTYRVTAAAHKAALSDQYGDATAVAATGLSLVAATFNHRGLVIEIDPDTMPSGKPWVTFEFDNVSSVLLLAGLGIGAPRYGGHLSPSVL
jgi:hypothetical protein